MECSDSPLKPNGKTGPAPAGVTLNELQQRYDDVRKDMEQKRIATVLMNEMNSVVTAAKRPRIDQFVCTSLGSFSAEANNKNRPMYQLIAFAMMKEVIGMKQL